MVNTFHKQAIHAILQPVMLRAPGCLCGLHRGSHRRPITFTRHAHFHPTRAIHQPRAPHFSHHQPLHGTRSCRGARYATAAPFSKADISLVQPNPSCRAAPAGHTASLPSGPATSDPGLPGVALSNSDEEDADLLEALSDGRSDADEAVTGYLQEGSADTVLVKSKTETHEQVQNRLVIIIDSGPVYGACFL